MGHATSLLASYFTLAGDINPLRGDTASPFDIRDRAEAASRAGFTGIGLFHTDLDRCLQKYDVVTLRSILSDNGLTHIELEFLFDWFSSGNSRIAADAIRNFLLEMADNLGAWHIKIGGDLVTTWPTPHLIEEFARLCDQAREHGTRISLEMAPVTTINSLCLAREIVEGAGRANGGYMIDIWHINRAGVSLEELASLPAGRVFGVEMNDASSRIVGSLLDDTLHRRRFCGEGDFDVGGFLDAIAKTGFSGPYGVEITSDELRRMPLLAAAERAYRTTSAFLR